MKLKKSVAVVAAAAALGIAGSAGSAQAGGTDDHGPGDGPGHGRGRTCATVQQGGGLRVLGLTADGHLTCFTANRPGRAVVVGAIDGLSGDTSIVGIDVRPATAELVGLGDAGGVYVIDPATAVASKRSQLDVALDGSSFGVDFNPTVDRLRIVSDTGQNLRADVDTGTVAVDSPLSSTAPPATPVTATGIVGAAYTNNDADPDTATTLYDIDATLDQVAIQAPPNAGVLNPTGKLGVDTSAAVGADILSVVREGTTVAVRGFASLTVGGRSGFYEITLATGRATFRGPFAPETEVIGIAVPLSRG